MGCGPSRNINRTSPVTLPPAYQLEAAEVDLRGYSQTALTIFLAFFDPLPKYYGNTGCGVFMWGAQN